MNRKDILDYARKTPTNTNVNVLGSMIDSVVRDSGESGDSGNEFLGMKGVEVKLTAESLPEGETLQYLVIDYIVNFEEQGSVDNNYASIHIEQDNTDSIIVPIMEGFNTAVRMLGNGSNLEIKKDQSDFTGDVSLDGNEIFVTGPGTMNLVWDWVNW